MLDHQALVLLFCASLLIASAQMIPSFGRAGPLPIGSVQKSRELQVAASSVAHRRDRTSSQRCLAVQKRKESHEPPKLRTGNDVLGWILSGN